MLYSTSDHRRAPVSANSWIIFTASLRNWHQLQSAAWRYMLWSLSLSLSLSLSHVYSTCTAVHDVIIACSLRNLSSPLSVRPTRRFSYEFNNSPTAKFQLQSVSIECRRFLTAPVLYDKESSNPRRTKRLSNKYMESIFSALVGLNHQHSQWRCFVYLWLPAEVRFSARVVVISLAVWRSVKYCDKCVCLQGRF